MIRSSSAVNTPLAASVTYRLPNTCCWMGTGTPRQLCIRRDGLEGAAVSIVRVFCMGGPVYGLQYLNEDTGRILFEHADQHVYRLKVGEHVDTDFGPCLAAYFDRTVPAG
jgi:hypothetical protein